MSLHDFLTIATSGLRPVPEPACDEAPNEVAALKKPTHEERARSETCDLRLALSL